MSRAMAVALDIAGRAGGNIVQYDLLRGASAQQDGIWSSMSFLVS